MDTGENDDERAAASGHEGVQHLVDGAGDDLGWQRRSAIVAEDLDLFDRNLGTHAGALTFAQVVNLGTFERSTNHLEQDAHDSVTRSQVDRSLET